MFFEKTFQFRCDFYDDCNDNSDEKDCGHYNCPPQQWPCPNSGHCIKIAELCNGKNDCDGGADEVNCTSNICSSLGCEADCHRSPLGGVCVCPKGYRLRSDGRTCEGTILPNLFLRCEYLFSDVNECTEWGHCDQKCENMRATYSCPCLGDCYSSTAKGYCKSAEHDQMRILASRREGLYRIDPNQKEASERLIAGEFIYGVDFDYREGKLFYTERLKHTIYNGHHRQKREKHRKYPETSYPRHDPSQKYRRRLDQQEALHRRNWSQKNRHFRLHWKQTGGSYCRRPHTLPIDVALDPLRG